MFSSISFYNMYLSRTVRKLYHHLELQAMNWQNERFKDFKYWLEKIVTI